MFGGILILFGTLLLLGVAITVAVLYLNNLQQLLSQVGTGRRKVPPTNVWLMFIPLFNLVYGFILYPKISESVKAEFEFRGHPKSGDYFKALGITMASISALRFVLAFTLPNVGMFVGAVNLVIFIIFWVKMAGYKSELRTMLNSDEFGLNSDSDLLDS